MSTTARIRRPELLELSEWADHIADAANDWAERSEATAKHNDLTTRLDGLARAARHVARMAEAIHGGA